jgi:hypothetical protein
MYAWPQALESGPRILEQHAITFDRSADLRHEPCLRSRPAWSARASPDGPRIDASLRSASLQTHNSSPECLECVCGSACVVCANGQDGRLAHTGCLRE